MRESDHLILIASGKIWAKATHIWLVSISGDNAANTAKVQGYALLPSDKAHGATKNISDNASAVSRDSRSKALATAPHLTPAHVAHLSHSSTPKRTKKPPCAQQESQCARRLKERIARKGGLRKKLWISTLLVPNCKKQFTFAQNNQDNKYNMKTLYSILAIFMVLATLNSCSSDTNFPNSILDAYNNCCIGKLMQIMFR